MRQIPHLLGVFLLIIIFFTYIMSSAQTDCGVVDNISYPIDTNQFILAQDYGTASARHQGRFHTGEDWYGGRGTTIGQPVRAAAKGRVVYSYKLGWGRDGGVVILEHTFPDGSIYYTQYGHLQETTQYTLPTSLTCVEQGDIIGAIGDVRPAPHLHFEVRVNNPDWPGPGYSPEIPFEGGFRDPHKFITNQQTWLNIAHQWHITVGDDSPADERGPLSPPLVLNDNSLLYLDGAGRTLRRATADGRVLWRQRLQKAAVSLMAFQGQSLLIFADGELQFVDVETGVPGDSWQVDATFADAPIVANNWLLFPTPENGLVALDESRREILWRANDLPPVIRSHVASQEGGFLLALITKTNEFLLLSDAGEFIERAQLMEPGSITDAGDGRILAYTRGGLWQVGADGDWSLRMNDSPSGGHSSAVLVLNERMYLFDGTTLLAYNQDDALLWRATVPEMSGLVEIVPYGSTLLLTSNHGGIAAISEAGVVCNWTRIFGSDDARQWHALGSDGTLRIAIADQILGLDWAQFTRGCT